MPFREDFSMSPSDFDAEERAFREQIESTLSEVRATAGHCPDPALLMAARSGVLSQSTEAVRCHVQVCPVCSQLSEDLVNHQFPGASDLEDRRIRAKGAVDRPTRSGVWRPLFWAAAVSLIAVVGIGITLIWRLVLQPPVTPGVRPTAQSISLPSNPSSVVLPLEKPAIRIPAASVLLYRSDAGSNESFLQDLAAALKPYRGDDYPEANRRLGSLRLKYPNSPEVGLYQGVSQLFLNENARAIDTLLAARRLADGPLRDSISWYLIVGLDREGRYGKAQTEAAALCARASEYKQKACAAADELKRR